MRERRVEEHVPDRSAAAGAGDPASLPAAWYVPRSGPWRDWVAILHLPYTVWHLSYVLIGAAIAPVFSVSRLVATLLAFALAVGVAAHAFDELRGRPLGTAIPAPILATVAAVALAGAVALGAIGIGRVGWGLAGFIGVGVVLVLAYNLEFWNGRLHNGVTFALGWGSFPVLTAYFAQASTIRPAAVVAAASAFGLSRAQRVLSTEARDLRRRTVDVRGSRTTRVGTIVALNRQSLLRPLEAGLVTLSWCTAALGVALVLARTGH